MMKALATSLLAALALTAGVAHADNASFGDSDNVPFQGIYSPRAAMPVPATGQTHLSQPSSVQACAKSVAGGDDTDDAGRTMLASGRDEDGRTQLA
jgi:hypothetical protein